MKLCHLIHRRNYSTASPGHSAPPNGHDGEERAVNVEESVPASPQSSNRQALVQYLRVMEEEEHRNAASHMEHLQELILRHQHVDRNHPSGGGPQHMPRPADRHCRSTNSPVSSDALGRLPRARILPMDKARFECDDTTCSICVGRLVDGIMLTRLPCGHVYHVTCLIPWLLHSHTCPDCRYELPSANDGAPEELARQDRMKNRTVYQCSCVQKGVHSCFFADPERSLADQCRIISS